MIETTTETTVTSDSNNNNLTSMAPTTLISTNNAEIVSTNIAQVLATPDTTVKSERRKKGRPVLHKFSGRITLLRDEVALALKDGPAFIEMMQADHKLDAERLAALMANGEISTEFTEMYLTFQGPIQMVLDEMAITMKRWEHRTVEMRVDFKKKRTTPDVEPVRNANNVIEHVEVYPDRIYGYLKMVYKNPSVAPSEPAA